MFAGAPVWMERMVYVLGVYALINFAIFITMVSDEPKNAPVGPLHWRGFSGHWMVFYSSALAVHPAATHTKEPPPPSM